MIKTKSLLNQDNMSSPPEDENKIKKPKANKKVIDQDTNIKTPEVNNISNKISVKDPVISSTIVTDSTKHKILNDNEYMNPYFNISYKIGKELSSINFKKAQRASLEITKTILKILNITEEEYNTTKVIQDTEETNDIIDYIFKQKNYY